MRPDWPITVKRVEIWHTNNMDWSDFSGKKIGLLGAGKENLSLIPHLIIAKAEVVVCEKNSDPRKLPENIEFRLGDNYLENLSDFDFVFRSPGLPVDIVKKSIENLTKKPIITSAMNLFLSMKGRQTIGVTGTMGKGTTATMITEIIKASGKEVILAGNIGESIFGKWDKITDSTVIVMEISSFQLEDVNSSPSIAVLLSITPDHLSPLSELSPNYHKNLSEYIKAKEHITTFQKPSDLIVFSADSQPSKQIGLASAAKKVSVSSRENADVKINDGIISFNKTHIDLNKETKLRGYHTLFNATVAIAVTSNLGISDEFIVRGLSNFKTLPHRMETIGVYGGIEYIDDSYATSPEATIAALSAFNDKELIVILGGSTKGANFDNLAKIALKRNIKLAVLIGQESKNIENSFKEFAPDIKISMGFSTFKDAIETAFHGAVSGGVVLLSPACASKDMFENAAERGDKFKKIIHELF